MAYVLQIVFNRRTGRNIIVADKLDKRTNNWKDFTARNGVGTRA